MSTPTWTHFCSVTERFSNIRASFSGHGASCMKEKVHSGGKVQLFHPQLIVSSTERKPKLLLLQVLADLGVAFGLHLIGFW